MASHSVAILIIGSLIWDTRDHRESWRRNRLRVGQGIPVKAPIRYGRISKDRDKTYTMVFSNELAPSRLGWALVVPCRCAISNPDHLVQEAQALWVAEQPKPSLPEPLSASWGAVGLLCNPASSGIEMIRSGWTERVAEEPEEYYNAFQCSSGEQAAVGRDGMLTIPWPTTESGAPLGVDLLIATATRPDLFDGAYATAKAIAAAWKRAPTEQRYFDENRRAGITTADDNMIMKHLYEESA